jgi:hypothetical protein
MRWKRRSAFVAVIEKTHCARICQAEQTLISQGRICSEGMRCMKESRVRSSLAAEISALANCFAGSSNASQEAPVFILAAGSCCGPTFLQRLVSPHCFIWGEPYEHSGLVASQADALRAFIQQLPHPRRFSQGQCAESTSQRFHPSLCPDPAQFLDTQRQFFRSLFSEPARKAGAKNWGMMFERLDSDHASYLKWLFPGARLVFLYRNPFDAYRSYAAGGDTDCLGRLTAHAFGTLWNRTVRGFLKHAEQLQGLPVAYETLGRGDFEAIERYLGFELSRDAKELNRSDGRLAPLPDIS